LTGLAAFSRLSAIDYMLPHLPEPDLWAIGQAEHLWAGGDAKNAPLRFYWYGTLIGHVFASTGEPHVLDQSTALNDLPAQLEASSASILRLRVLVALISVLSVPAVFLLARRFLGDRGALLAAAFFATSFLHIQFATQARPHAVQMTLALLAMLSFFHLARAPTALSYLLSGALTAAAIGAFQNGIFLLPALLLAHLFRSSRGGHWKLAIPSVLIGASALWFYPFFSSPQEAARTTDYGVSEGEISMGAHRLKLANFNGEGLEVVVSQLWENDPILFVMAVLGALLGASAVLSGRMPIRTERARDLAIACAYAVPHLAVLALYKNTYGRFLLPLLPYLACLAAHGTLAPLDFLTRKVRPAFARAGAAAACLALLALPTYASWRLLEVRSAPDTFQRAADWIAANLAPDDGPILTTPGLFLPLFYQRDSLEELLRHSARDKMYGASVTRWARYQDRLPEADGRQAYDFQMLRFWERDMDRFSEADRFDRFIRRRGWRYAVVEVSERSTCHPDMKAAISHIERNGQLLAEFLPRAEELSLPPDNDYQNAPHMLARTLRSTSFGPILRIYRFGD
jgi:hypothetical protein